MKFLRDELNLVLVNFMVVNVNIRIIFNNTCRVKSFLHTKTVLAALKDRKWCTGLVVGTAIFSTSIKGNDDYMIGRPNILRLSHNVVTLPLL